MNNFHLGILGNFGVGEIILIFLLLAIVAVPVAIVLLVVYLSNKTKAPSPPSNRRLPQTTLAQNPTSAHIAGLHTQTQVPTFVLTAANLYSSLS
jgi:hypothetical protein